MSNLQLAYWEECITCAAEDNGIALTRTEVTQLAEGVLGGHENYGMAFYSPPPGDRLSEIDRGWKAKLDSLQREFDAYRNCAETAVRKALNQYSDANIEIREHGEVLRYGGSIDRIQ
jgi:hypothetical protein